MKRILCDNGGGGFFHEKLATSATLWGKSAGDVFLGIHRGNVSGHGCDHGLRQNLTNIASDNVMMLCFAVTLIGFIALVVAHSIVQTPATYQKLLLDCR
jgi:hypothetical protein